MSKKTKKPSKYAAEKIKKDEAALAAAKAQKTTIASAVSEVFKTAELIAVDPDFSEVNFYVYQNEYDNMQRNFSTAAADFKFERGDKDELMLYFTYKIK